MSSFNLERLQEVSLTISALSCDCRVWKLRRNHRVGGLVTFRGRYMPGSAGKHDALWIKWRLNEFHELARPDGVVIDCRELDYIWGDDLYLRPWQMPQPFPFLVVLRPEQQEAYAYAEPREQHRLDLSAALAELDQLLRALQV